jgi:hypothetical protein
MGVGDGVTKIGTAYERYLLPAIICQHMEYDSASASALSPVP